MNVVFSKPETVGWRERNRLEHLQLFQKTQVHFPGTHIIGLTTPGNTGAKGSGTLFWLL